MNKKPARLMPATLPDLNENRRFSYLRKNKWPENDAPNTSKTFQKITARNIIPNLGLAVDVLSVYNCLPVNALKFSRVEGDSVTDISPTEETLTLTYTVPDGYVGILETIEYEFMTIYALYPATKVSISVSVDGNIYTGLSGRGFRQINSEKVFIVADQAQTFSVTITRSASGFDFAPREQLVINMEGVLLPKRGLPANFEQGNLRKMR